MKRIILAILVVLVFPVVADAVLARIDNERIATGTVNETSLAGETVMTVSGLSYDTKTASRGSGSYAVGDIANVGLYFLTGASAGTHIKIASASGNDLTADGINTFPALSVGDTFEITVGCNQNTGGSFTPNTGTTGPYLTINKILNTNPAGVAHTIIVRKSNRVYGETQDTKTYLEWAQAGDTFVMFGIDTATGVTLVSQSDLYILNASATGSTLVDTNFPEIRPSHATNCIVFTSNSASSLTLTCLKITHAGASTKLIANDIGATGVPITIDKCSIGEADAQRDQSGFYDNSTAGNGSTNKRYVFTQTKFNTSAYNVHAMVCRTLSIDDCLLTLTPAQASASAYDNIRIIGYSYDSTKTPNSISITDSVFNVVDSNVGTASKAGRSLFIRGVDQSGTQTNDTGLTFCDHIRITGNTMTNRMTGSCIEVGPCPSLEIRNNYLYTYNDIGGTIINLYPDNGAPKEFWNTRRRRTVLTGLMDAGSGATSAVLVGSSASDDAYNNYMIQVTSPLYNPGGLTPARPLQPLSQIRQITDYVGATKTCTTTVNWDYNPVAGDVYEIFNEPIQSCVITGNWCQHGNISSTSLYHGVLLGQTWDDALVSHNTIIGGDNGLVLKADGCTVEYNNIYAAGGTLLIKGGSFNTVRYNSCYMGRDDASGGPGCLQLMDMSYPSNSLHYAAYSKCMGNVITDNIFVCRGVPSGAGVNRACIYDRNDIGTSDWSTYKTTGPVYQHNRINRNLYWRDDDPVDGTADTPFFNLGGTSLNRLSDLQSHWAAKTAANPPYVFPFTDNDANSYEGNPGFASPSTGNFNIARTSPAWGRGFGGSNMGAYQPSSGVTAGTTIIRPDRRVP